MIKKYPENDPYDGQTVSIPMITFQQFMETRQLCRDMYENGCYSASDDNYLRTIWLDDYADRMKQLGLLEGDQND